MLTGRSLLPVFGFWVAWVYLLSLIVLRPLQGLDLADPPLRPSVRFLDADEVFRCDAEAGANGLAELVAELSEPLDHDVAIPVTATPVAAPTAGAEAARPGEDYTADRDAVFVFEAGSTRGVLRRRDDLLDVTVAADPTAAVARRFRLGFAETADVVVAPDPQGLRVVEIPPPSARPLVKGNGTQFRELLVDVDERNLIDHRFVIEAERPADQDAELRFSLYRIAGPGQLPVRHFTGTMPAGARETSFSLRELVPAEDLARLGVAYDPRPGVDEWYELHLDARPPLISAADPCFTTIFCRDRDEPATVAFRFEDEAGETLQRIRADRPFFVTAELSHPIEVDCPVTPVVEGTPLLPGGVIPAGERSSQRMGPFRLPADLPADLEEVFVSLTPEPDDGLRRCRSCAGRPGGCDDCRKACKSCGGQPDGCPACRPRCGKCEGQPGRCSDCESACKDCGGRPGGCRTCRGGCAQCGDAPSGCKECRGTCGACGGPPGSCEECKPACGQCGGRKGGCAACGNGSGVCKKCQGKPGPCGVCGGSGGGGSGGGGSGGGGSGGGGSGGGGRGSGRGGGSGSGGGGGGGGGGGAGGGAGGGGQSPVTPPPATSLANGPPVPGDFMIFLVNNQRLHEPGDMITDRVREAIKDRNPYKQGVIVINRDGRESLLTESSEPPAPERTFEPFSLADQDLEGQTRRIVETVARKRRNAENPEIRTLVVWPEREFVSASSLEVFGELGGDGRGPISFLLPDADPERARELAAALLKDAESGDVTVRSPKAEELVEHIDDVLEVIAASPEDRLNLDRAKP